MSFDLATLGERQKRHEHTTRHLLPRKTFTLLRVDGKSFHSYTRGLVRPFDEKFAGDMDATAVALCQQITGTLLAYVQSDEISILAYDFNTVATEAWMGGVLNKVVSLSSAMATATFNQARPEVTEAGKLALFDSRAWTIQDPAEVADYFVWRQRDATKNSVSMAASTYFSHERLMGMNTDQRKDLLLAEAGVDWNDYPEGFKSGRWVTRVPVDGSATFAINGTEETIKVTRNVWRVEAAPRFARESLIEFLPGSPVEV